MDVSRPASTADSPTASPVRATGLGSHAGMFQSLRLPDFRLLWIANLVASFAMQMQMVARGWLIYDITSSPLALTWVMLSFMLPSFVFSLWGGVIADRVRKKPIMIVGQIVNAAATVAFATIVYRGDVTFWHFIYFGLFNGAIMSLSMPARAAVVPEIVPERIMVNAMALQSATYSAARVAGPALAGWLIAWFAGGDANATHSSATAVGLVLYIIAAMYLVSVAATALLRYQGDPTPRPDARMLDDIAEGFRYMRRERIVLGLLVMGIVPMMFGFAPSSLAPVFNKEILDGDPLTLGYLMTAMGVGSLAGSLLLARLGDIGGKGRIMFACCYVWALGLAGFALSPTLAVAMAFGIFIGIFGSLVGSLNMSVVTLAIAPEIRGRVMSIMMMSFGIMPIGMIPIAAAAEFTGIASALLGSAVLLAVSMAGLGWWFPELRRIDKGHGGG
ncbi:MAG: MFS transporter [Gammaproteobacteria bacterium]|nr:MFS transporter [Gammaproteobacteria bacterium]MYF27830.1 MFS transporter [Gammaproteobacteria bacterium]MYK45278.1 MFS transporter [Gammaproteobacteria bacterium]